jgi:hypothetical protein
MGYVSFHLLISHETQRDVTRQVGQLVVYLFIWLAVSCLVSSKDCYEALGLLRRYASQNGSWSPTFRDRLLVPFS